MTTIPGTTTTTPENLTPATFPFYIQPFVSTPVASLPTGIEIAYLISITFVMVFGSGFAVISLWDKQKKRKRVERYKEDMK